MNAKVKLASAVVLSVFLTACGSTPKAPAEPIKISSQVKNFTISNEFGEVSKSDIARALATNINAISAYESYGARRHQGSTTTSSSIRGLQVQSEDDGNLRLRYMHTDVVELGSFSSYHDAILGVQVSQQGDYQTVMVTTPTEVTRFDKEVLFVLKVRQIDTTENITKDVIKISDQLDLTVEKVMDFSVELATEYSVEAVIHSINRKHPVSNVKGTSESRSFSFNIDGTTVTAKLSPFRNGSMLDYKYALPYTLYSNGTTDLSKLQLTEQSEKIKQKIQSSI